MRPLRHASFAWLLFAPLAFAACSGSDGGAVDPGGDAIADAADDATSDVASDAELDGASDTGGTTDAKADAKADAVSDAADASDASDAGATFDPHTWKPTGKGLWIWYFSYTGLSAAQAAQKAKDAGVGWVLIKSGQDANFWSTRYTADALKEFTSRGMHVFAWPYVTPADVTGSIDAIVKAIDVPGTDGIILDVEVEFEGTSHAAAATQLCKGIRQKRPKVFLGFTSFGWPQYHTTFPWKQFDTDCGDAWMPQSYWSDRGVTWTKGYDETIAGTKTVGIKAPLWIIQSNDDIYNGGGAPTTADLNAFFDKAGVMSSLWEFPSSSAPSKLTQLASLHFPNP
jgi:hypothetical protein